VDELLELISEALAADWLESGVANAGAGADWITWTSEEWPTTAEELTMCLSKKMTAAKITATVKITEYLFNGNIAPTLTIKSPSNPYLTGRPNCRSVFTAVL
jgi:hypothetical protein